ncbi:MAG: DUF3124 domain-containing protein [Cyclobacteriaceae bacterium]
MLQIFSAINSKWQWVILSALGGLTSLGCENPARQERKLMPSRNYHYVEHSTEGLAKQENVYVPVYSDIYHQSGEQRFLLTATLSIRNTSVRDSMYVDQVDYYNSEGVMQRAYLSQTIVIGPLSSVEFVVENTEAEGGAGANFIVHWASDHPRMKPIIQSVMIGTTSQQGISFVVDGRVMETDTTNTQPPVQ